MNAWLLQGMGSIQLQSYGRPKWEYTTSYLAMEGVMDIKYKLVLLPL